MADELKYKIHSVSEEDRPVIVSIDGIECEAKVRYLVIDASSDDGSMSHTFKIRNGDASKYQVGGNLMVKLAS